MVRLADGRTIVLSEGADDDPRGREALLYVGDPAEPGPEPIRFLYDSDGRGPVSDAAPLPDGRILLVHRRLGFDPVFTTILSVDRKSTRLNSSHSCASRMPSSD